MRSPHASWPINLRHLHRKIPPIRSDRTLHTSATALATNINRPWRLKVNCSTLLNSVTLTFSIFEASTSLPIQKKSRIGYLTQRFKRKLLNIYSAIPELFYEEGYQHRPTKARISLQKQPAKKPCMVIHKEHYHLNVNAMFVVLQNGQEDQKRRYRRFPLWRIFWTFHKITVQRTAYTLLNSGAWNGTQKGRISSPSNNSTHLTTCTCAGTMTMWYAANTEDSCPEEDN